MASVTFGRMRMVLVIGILWWSSNLCWAQNWSRPVIDPLETEPNNVIRLVFYNVENLFDTIDDPHRNDNEYLPGSKKNWETGKYFAKLNHVSKVIRLSGGIEPPDIVGLAEIENLLVLKDLIRRPSLAGHGYEIIHFDSPDRRGIDVALLFRKESFFPFQSRPILVRDSTNQNFRTRDILFVSGIVSGGDTLHLFVNHWPSRLGGKQASEPKRMLAAKTLDQILDSLDRQPGIANYIIMGDFNDEYFDASIREGLDAEGPDQESTGRIDLMTKMDPNRGTHYYRGLWAYLDQFIISRGLWDQRALECTYPMVFDPPYLLETTSRGNTFPKRSWKGSFFTNGFSDHLPIIIDLFNETGR